jgi:probable HAF family extracellular repeat protein
MKRAWFRWQFVGAFAASAFLAQIATAQGQKAHAVQYTVTDLGLVGPSPGPTVITNNGLIADSMGVSDVWHATLWFLGMQFDLVRSGGLPGANSGALGVNERGQAAGQAETNDPDPNLEDFCAFGSRQGCQAFLWQYGVMSALPMLKDANGLAGRNAAAKGINILGQVAGTAENTTIDTTCPAYDPSPMALQFQKYQFKPVIWENGEVKELATSGTDASGNAFNDPDGVVFRINDHGLAVGATGTCTGLTNVGTYLNSLHATLWQNGAVTDLGNLGGIAPQGFGNFAYNINRWGHVVGTSGTKDGSFHAFFWSPDTLIQDLGTVADDAASVGLAISDVGDIGGVSFPSDPNAAPRAFIRPDGGTMTDLNSLVTGNTNLYLFSICSINSRGQIIGLALDAEGNFHGYLATPSDGAASSVDSSEARSQRFEFAWQLARDRLGRHWR